MAPSRRTSQDDAASPMSLPLSPLSSSSLLASLTPSSLPGTPQPQPRGTLTRLNGIALVISLQIGSGIFAAPSQVSQFVSSPFSAVCVWFLSGLLVWTGAASFVELGHRIPNNGGIQEYLRVAYGDVAGFLFTWVWVVIAKPAANAVIATVFAGYASRGFSGGGAERWPEWATKGLALGCVGFITWVNCLGATVGAKAANLFLLLKLGAVAAVAGTGLFVLLAGTGEGVPASKTGWFGNTPVEGSDGLDGLAALWTVAGNFATACFGALYCYGGWETVGFVLGDMKHPESDLPVVLNTSMAVAIAGFVLMNAALYVVVPMEVMRENTTVVVELARRTLGPWGSLFFCIIISLCSMGAMNSYIFTTAALCVEAGHRSYFPHVFANAHCDKARDEPRYIDEVLGFLHPVIRAPFHSLAAATRRLRWEKEVSLLPVLLNGALASFYVLIGTFNGLITFIGLTEYSCFLASVLSLFVLRAREDSLSLHTGAATASARVITIHHHHHQEQRYPTNRTWTANPAIFSALSTALIFRVLITEPLQGLSILAIQALGLGVFYARFGNLRGASQEGVD